MNYDLSAFTAEYEGFGFQYLRIIQTEIQIELAIIQTMII